MKYVFVLSQHVLFISILYFYFRSVMYILYQQIYNDLGAHVMLIFIYIDEINIGKTRIVVVSSCILI